MMNSKMTQKMLRMASLVVMVSVAMIGAASASSDGGAVHNSWLTIDTWKVLNFGILALGAFIVIKKTVPPLLKSRSQGIEEEINELETKKADAEKKLAEYQAKFKNLDQESKQIVEDYIKQGEEAKTRILAEAEEQAEKLEDMAKRNIEQEFKAAKATLQQEVVAKAMEKAEEVIKASISSDDQDKLVDDYLKKVVA